jgi:Transposase DDE domain
MNRLRARQLASHDERVLPEAVVGGKYVRLLDRFLRELRGEEAHGNRRLFLDDVFVAYLLAFFNPTIRSLRTIEDFSQTVQARKHVSIPKLCRSTLSDFNRLVDPQRLAPIVEALRNQLARKHATQHGNRNDLAELLERTIAVDGTFLPATADVAWALSANNQQNVQRRRARLDVQLSVESWLPEVIVIAPGQSESASAIQHVQSGKLYLYDRGFSGYALLNAHYRAEPEGPVADAHFVVRYRQAGGNSPELADAEPRLLGELDRAAGVVSDRVGRFVSTNQARHAVHDVPLREVLVQYESAGEKKTLRLVTNLLDVSALTIAQLYRYRWQIELFFRWLKCFGNFGHLISHSHQGVLAHFYVTVIAMLLMYLHTGYRPSKYLFVLMSQVAAGGASLEEVLPILRERERQNDLARQSAARRRAKKKQPTK